MEKENGPEASSSSRATRDEQNSVGDTLPSSNKTAIVKGIRKDRDKPAKLDLNYKGKEEEETENNTNHISTRLKRRDSSSVSSHTSSVQHSEISSIF